jgi:hypothetical protein
MKFLFIYKGIKIPFQMPYYFIEDLFIGGWMADRCNVPRFNVTKGVIVIKNDVFVTDKGG